MESNALTLVLAQKLSHTLPRWERIMEKYALQVRTSLPNVVVEKLLRNLYLRTSLEYLASDPRLDGKLQSYKIPHRYAIARYEVWDKDFELSLHPTNKSEIIDLGELVIVDGLPVVFSLKTGVWRRRSVHSTTSGSKGAYYTFLPARVQARENAVRELTQSPCGHVVVMPPEHFLEHADVLRYFGSQGGIVVPFYTDRKSWRQELESKIQQYQLAYNSP